ncbi:MAG: biotin/lipoyl-binding protein [Ruminococcus sp.]|nr:biotin/lipoyl-binding protein [Ruminococcus sp.]MDY3895670.1 biotin/lipoyl-containing protein [Candidatus Fimenecus sp.]
MKYVVTLNGKDYEVEVDELSEAIVTNVAPTAAPAPAAPVAAQPSAPAAAPAPVSGSGTAVKAPMPGTILKVNVTAGQSVKAGDIMFILEAMKMENEIVAPSDGTVSQIVTAKGSSVATDDVLAYLN